MKEKEVIDLLLCKEIEIDRQIHNTVTEILKSGWDSKKGKAQVAALTEGIEYILEDIQNLINR